MSKEWSIRDCIECNNYKYVECGICLECRGQEKRLEI